MPIYIMLDYEYKMLIFKTGIRVVGKMQNVALCTGFDLTEPF